MRVFKTGATRDADDTKPEYAGFLSPLVLKRFAEFMHEKRKTPLGPRSSRNWRKGIPQSAYLESAFRHLMDVWLYVDKFDKAAHEGYEVALCALLFNVQGLLHEALVKKYGRGRLD